MVHPDLPPGLYRTPNEANTICPMRVAADPEATALVELFQWWTFMGQPLLIQGGLLDQPYALMQALSILEDAQHMAGPKKPGPET